MMESPNNARQYARVVFAAAAYGRIRDYGRLAGWMGVSHNKAKEMVKSGRYIRDALRRTSEQPLANHIYFDPKPNDYFGFRGRQHPWDEHDNILSGPHWNTLAHGRPYLSHVHPSTIVPGWNLRPTRAAR